MQRLVFLLLLLFLTASQSFAACHVVTPSGNGSRNGNDWSNAYAKLPSPVTRGDTYYLADGSYGNYTVNTPGSTATTIKKATASDHCTDTGWNAATMGASQAVFTGLNFSSGNSNNFTFDGNGTSTKIGCGTAPTPGGPGTSSSDCGFKLDNTISPTDAPILLSSYNGSPATGIALRYWEVAGSGTTPTSQGQEQRLIYAPQTSGSNFTYDHVYSHDAACVHIQQYGGGRTVKNSYFWKNYSQSAQPANGCHGQYAYNDGVNGVFEFNNIFRDIEGTAVMSFDSGGGTNVQWYNNLFFYSSPPLRQGVADGMVWCGNGAACNNFRFQQNTIVNFSGSYNVGLMVIPPATGSGNLAQNNIWYGNNEDISFPGWSEDHNSFLNNTGVTANPGSGPADVYVGSGSPNPFTNLQAGDFRLASQNANWGAGATLASPFNVDLAGNSRPGTDGVWNRGPYQFAGAQAQGPAAPTSLVARTQ